MGGRKNRNSYRENSLCACVHRREENRTGQKSVLRTFRHLQDESHIWQNAHSIQHYIPARRVDERTRRSWNSTADGGSYSIARGGSGNLRRTQKMVPSSLTLPCTSLNFSKIVPKSADEGVRGDGIRKGRLSTRDGELRHSTQFCSTRMHPGPPVP